MIRKSPVNPELGVAWLSNFVVFITFNKHIPLDKNWLSQQQQSSDQYYKCYKIIHFGHFNPGPSMWTVINNVIIFM